MTTNPTSSPASIVRDLLRYANSLDETHSSFNIGNAGVEATPESTAINDVVDSLTGRGCCTKGEQSGMSCVVERLATFKKWPRESKVNTNSLTRAGFFYTGSGDKVKCFFCNGEIENWEFGDSAIEEHKRFFPKCKFVRETCMQNLLLLNEGSSGRQPNPRPSERLASEYRRVLTFLPQPHTSPIECPCPIQAQALARAGFYYVHIRDVVRCFVCMGEISNCESVDMPVVQHITMFPDCPFVRGEDVGNEKMTTINVMNIQQALIYREPVTKLPVHGNGLPNHVGQLRRTAKFTDQWPYIMPNPLVRTQRHPFCINHMGHSSEIGATFYHGGADIQQPRYVYFPQEIGLQEAWQPYYPQVLANGRRVLQRLVLPQPKYMKVVNQLMFFKSSFPGVRYGALNRLYVPR